MSGQATAGRITQKYRVNEGFLTVSWEGPAIGPELIRLFGAVAALIEANTTPAPATEEP